MAFTRMAFNPTDGLKNTSTYPTTPASESAARAQIQAPLDQLKVALNGLMAELEKTTGTSGADQIGSAEISGVTGTTVRDQISDLYAQIQSLVLGEINPETILIDKVIKTNMIDDEAVDTDQIADKAITADKIDDDAVGTDALVNNSVTNEKLDTGAVKEVNIDTGAVTNPKINIAHTITEATGSDYDSYPRGVSHSIIWSGNKGSNFPTYGTLFTVNHSSARLFQIIVQYNGTRTYVRSYRDGTWQDWKELLRYDSLEWKAIATDRALDSSGGDITIPSLAGYKEAMLQIKGATGTSAAVMGSIIVPLQSDGKGNPSESLWVALIQSDGFTMRSFKINSATNIEYGYFGESGRYLSVFAR